MRSGRARKLAGTAALCCALLPGAARAQEPGVHVDPQSPAGTEYALPLVQARGDHSSGGSGGSHSGGSAAANGGGSAQQPGAAPARFGAGISRAGNAGGGGGRGSGSSQRGTSPGGGGPAAPPRDIATAAAHPDSTSPAIAGIAGGVVLAGLGLGLLLRRRSRGV